MTTHDTAAEFFFFLTGEAFALTVIQVVVAIQRSRNTVNANRRRWVADKNRVQFNCMNTPGWPRERTFIGCVVAAVILLHVGLAVIASY